MKASIYFFLMLLVMMGCSENMNMKFIDKENDMKVVKAEATAALKDKRIYFGHASVGRNIIDGITEISANDQQDQKINILELKDIYEINEPALYHSKNGKNGFPKSKVDAFVNTLEKDGFGNKLDIAFFKFCYVDFNKDTNVPEVFDYYVKNIEDIKKEFPRLKLVHVTTPLYAHAWGLKGVVKNLIKGDISNVKRNQFNTMLINKFNNVDPIYDLAKIESMYPDGGRASFRYKGESYFSLVTQYTDDGGHLNEAGRYYAAKELLRTLSEVNKNNYQ